MILSNPSITPMNVVRTSSRTFGPSYIAVIAALMASLCFSLSRDCSIVQGFVETKTFIVNASFDVLCISQC